ncbi:MAG TPA: SDR family oxidoreductase [Pedobacter sp.]|nr:SDR family oxidoreductase [Pedobacter sp.]
MEQLSTYFQNAVSGKRILITGGTTGIGREIAIQLAAAGGRCVICGRSQEPLDQTMAEINSNDNPLSNIGLVADLAVADDIYRIFEAVDNELGGIDVLINNAAVAYGSILEGNYQDWQYVINTNLLGYLTCSNEAAKRMLASGSGHIINIGSMSADVREENSSVYVATKSGIQGFSEALRKELNPGGIKVSLIEPGAVDTDMQPASGIEKAEQVKNLEMLKAHDIAMAVLFCLAQPLRSDVVRIQIRPHLQLI